MSGEPSTPRLRIAVTLPAGQDVQSNAARLRWAEHNGYDDAWFHDAGAPDSLTLAAGLASQAQRLRMGVAVTPVFTRTPAVLAATASVLGQLLPGRFVMGLGASSLAMMSGWNGLNYERPLTRVRETVELVRQIMAGEKTAFEGDTLRSHGYRQLGFEPQVPLYLAALRPKMIEMAAGSGDGVIFNLWPRKALSRMIEHVHAGARGAGKTPDTVEVVNRFVVMVTDDKAAARELFRQQFAPYYATPVYNRFLAWAGYEAAAEQIREGWDARDRDRTTGALIDELVDDIAVIGSAEECQERLRWAAASGIHTHIIAPLATDPDAVSATFDAFRPERFSF